MDKMNPLFRTLFVAAIVICPVLLSGCPWIPAPNVVGLTEAEIESKLPSGVSTNITRQCSDTVASGLVIRTDPPANQEIDPYSHGCEGRSILDVYISTGPCGFTAPNVIGDTEESALGKIVAAGMTPHKTGEQCSDTVTAGLIISQNPAAGTNVQDSMSPVSFVVSTGPCPLTVPNVTGFSEASARAAIETAGFKVGVVSYECSDTVAKDIVITQSPFGGLEAAPNSNIDITLSTGPCGGKVPVPSVVGFTQEVAESRLESDGFTNIAVSVACSDTVEQGSVISQNPAGGALATTDITVEITVASGPCPVTVPNVVGFSEASARAAIETAGLVVDAVNTGCRNDVAAGLVFQQSPVAGLEVEYGSAVNLGVSSGPCAQQVTVPDIVGLSQSAGETALTNAGLSTGQTTEQCSDTVASGNIISQNPVAGTLVDPGATIDVVISVGGCNVIVTVPDLSGQTQPAATEQLTNLGLQLGTATYEHHETILAGLVIGQTPAPDTQVDDNSSVDLTVSMGPDDPDIRMIMLPGGIPLPMVWCPGGTFNMGSDNFFEGAYPLHEVQLTKGYWLSKYELTEEQWKSITAEHPLGYELNNPKHPMVNISWNDSQSFISTLNNSTGKSFRLPTEAEWEKACRAGTTTRFYWGDDNDLSMIDQYAWHYGNTGSIGDSGYKDVGQKLPNALGLYDIIGNIDEWCQDWNSDYPRDGITLIDPTGPETGYSKIYRGGSAYSMNPEDSMQSFSRRYSYPDDRMCGIRLCHSEGLTE